ncbi:DNA-binding protein [Streptomyces solincola]|uniref:DNA-binding protein n=1 Tax=Streptomyces solincola TaxID=2100817 RepID=A0A2S9Q277_9ACTN|nr:pyridoxamine 5'-phosphate oxidase family protein [Streptomyces solincola]PRH80771.1 DNA-binding protein [Streptomyces solincola]
MTSRRQPRVVSADEPGVHRSDIGRRAAARRAALGLTPEDVALRTGSAPGYIRYVEEGPSTPGAGFLLRLAGALETDLDELTGLHSDLPAGVGRAAGRSELVVLDEQECWALVGHHGVGRVALAAGASYAPEILPVNYTVVQGEVAYRTASDAAPAAAAGRAAGFEVDRIDEAFSRGWSVLMTGTARSVTEPGEARALGDRAYSAPWAGGGRELWIVLTPQRVTGRRIVTPDG